MKIGFFGDSFCESYEYWGQIALPWLDLDVTGKKKDRKFKGMNVAQMRSDDGDAETWIKKVCDHFDGECVHTGTAGTSIWDNIINQFQEYMTTKGLPDIAVFCWTDHTRLYHKEHRTMNYNGVMNHKNTTVPKKTLLAARMYYEELFDMQQSKHAFFGAMHYFDNLLETFEGSGHGQMKVIHCHNYGLVNDLKPGDRHEWRNLLSYPHEWKNGMMIKPSLINLMVEGHKYGDISRDCIESYSANHIHGDDKNQRLADAIIKAIENYDSKRTNSYKYKVRKLRMTKEIIENGRIPLTTI